LARAIRVLEYLDTEGRSPFANWLDGLHAPAAAKVTAALYQLEAGNFSSCKSVGGGVLERRIDSGPGYRIYFGRQSERVVILLGGSTKTRQDRSISIARQRWLEYRRRRSPQ